MKPSTKLKKASVHYYKAMEILNSFDDELIELLDDDCAHISFSTDGLVIVSNGGYDNSNIGQIDIDEFMKLTDKKKALDILERAGI